MDWERENNTRNRCGWVKNIPLEIAYHDSEWGVPIHDDQKLFEFLLLEGAQAGLSWTTVLSKREHYRQAYDGFNPILIAQYDEKKKEQLLNNAGIIRNKLKIEASILNARQFIRIQQEFGSFDAYIWQFVRGKTLHNHWTSTEAIPAFTPESDLMSKELKRRGFKFVGTTICYAFMQAVGLVNDHTVDCFRHQQLLD
jgi:DNA-3-methyladenine glycosylase I